MVKERDWMEYFRALQEGSPTERPRKFRWRKHKEKRKKMTKLSRRRNRG